MRKKALSTEEALEVLRRAGCSEEVIKHCRAVARVAARIAEEFSRHLQVDVEKVKVGAILHDIGRARTHGISHGVEGGRILREMGLDEYAGFAENHIGGGLPASEARSLGLPARNFFPQTLEEKIVAYADKLVEGDREVPFEKTLANFRRKLGEDHPAIGRLIALREQIERLKKHICGTP